MSKQQPHSEAAALLNVKDVAAVLNTSVRSVYRLADSGRMPRPVRMGGTSISRWKKADILEWIEAGTPDCRKTANR